MKRFRKVWLLFALMVLIVPATSLPSDETRLPSTEPQYSEKGELKRPADYQTWVFVGSNIGLQYRKPVTETTEREQERRKEKEKGDFHNVYINAEAYAHYKKTGKFPDKTMLVMDVYEAKDKEPKNIVSKGFFPGNQL